MEELERDLRDLRLREPSPELDARIGALLNEQTAAPTEARLGARRVGIGWAAAACVLAAALGFVAGLAVPGEDTGGSWTQASRVRVIYESPGARNPFDMTTVDATEGVWSSPVDVQKGDDR